MSESCTINNIKNEVTPQSDYIIYYKMKLGLPIIHLNYVTIQINLCIINQRLADIYFSHSNEKCGHGKCIFDCLRPKIWNLRLFGGLQLSHSWPHTSLTHHHVCLSPLNISGPLLLSSCLPQFSSTLWLISPGLLECLLKVALHS